MNERHSFAIPVYGKPPHLTACLDSIFRQTRQSSQVVIATSTPSTYLEGIAAQYRIPLHVNPHRSSIAVDWNFAMNSCGPGLVTIAHQDDLYDERYVDVMCDAFRRYPETLIAFSDFREHTPDGPRDVNINLRIKRILCGNAFGRREALSLNGEKRRLLAFGNPVCCPSVLINRGKMPDFQFADSMKTNLDWEAWARMSQLPGQFVYVRQVLVSKCVHPQSETSVTIASRVREFEDRHMFEKFWPKPVARIISVIYKLGYLANRV